MTDTSTEAVRALVGRLRRRYALAEHTCDRQDAYQAADMLEAMLRDREALAPPPPLSEEIIEAPNRVAAMEDAYARCKEEAEAAFEYSAEEVLDDEDDT